MPRIIATGTQVGTVPNEQGSGGTNDVHRYVTFEGYNGDIHSVFVNEDHPLTDPKQIVEAYYDQTLTTEAPQPAQPEPAQQPTVGPGY